MMPRIWNHLDNEMSSHQPPAPPQSAGNVYRTRRGPVLASSFSNRGTDNLAEARWSSVRCSTRLGLNEVVEKPGKNTNKRTFFFWMLVGEVCDHLR